MLLLRDKLSKKVEKISIFYSFFRERFVGKKIDKDCSLTKFLFPLFCVGLFDVMHIMVLILYFKLSGSGKEF